MTKTALPFLDRSPREVQPGDVGIVLQPDGNFWLFASPDFDLEDPKPEQQESADRLTAIAVALSVPRIMDMLKRFARDPEVVAAFEASAA